jgi:hypothetical protein
MIWLFTTLGCWCTDQFHCFNPYSRGWSPNCRPRVDCMRDIFILNEIWALGKTHISLNTFLGWNTVFYLSLTLVPLLTPNYKQHICRRLKSAELYVKCVHLGGGGATFTKRCKGGRKLYDFENLCLIGRITISSLTIRRPYIIFQQRRWRLLLYEVQLDNLETNNSCLHWQQNEPENNLTTWVKCHVIWS